MKTFTVSGIVHNSNTGKVKITSFVPNLYQSFPLNVVYDEKFIGVKKGTRVKLAFQQMRTCTKLIDYRIEEK